MKAFPWFCALLLLSSCSLLQRRAVDAEEDPGVRDLESGEEAPLFSSNGQELGASAESEVSRLNTKISALETKVDVLSASLERLQLQKSQPVIHAEPQARLASPVAEAPVSVADAEETSSVSAAPAPVQFDSETVPSTPGNVETAFREAMDLMRAKRNLEASSRFSLLAKSHPEHLLAAHSLYWAGETAARAAEWKLAIRNWSQLEATYPRSSYLSDTLAGLARANEALGNPTQAAALKNSLRQRFPRSPAARNLALDTGRRPLAGASAGIAPPQKEPEELVPEFTEETATAPGAEGNGR